ncbi:MAG TPA: PEPxxWA-CTERM sorting domain-containing protein [Caulobacteraceae bacterium]|nr:PEPxxWA-CTERM sorting domain-containing protein [Caulobacteraceae bacterium]
MLQSLIARQGAGKTLLLSAAALALLASAATARTNDPGYLQYDGGAQLLGPNDQPATGSTAGSYGGSGSGSTGGSKFMSGSPTAATLDLSFEGVSQYDTRALNGGFSFIPPDTMGAIGATQFMETSNGGYAVYDKATGAQTELISDGAFWTAAGQTEGTYPNGLPLANGDSRVLFDARSQKWIVESFGANLDTIQIAVSTTSNALGPWKSTSFTGFAGGIADYPTVAIDGKAVYIGTNDFTAGGSFAGETLNVINRSDLFGATPTTASLKQFYTPFSAIVGGADPGFAIQGVNQLSNTDSGRILAVSIQTSDLIRYDVNNPGKSYATLSQVSYLGTTPYDANSPGRQPSALNPRVIDTLDDRVSSAVWESKGLIYAVHTVTPTGTDHTAVVWTVSDAATNTLIQEGTIGGNGDGFDYYQGSIAVNAAGQVVIGYDRSGSDPTDGTITFFAQTFNPIKGGGGGLVSTGVYLLHVSNTNDYHNGSLDGQAATGRQRWGDYSQVTVDPSNMENFWMIGEFGREPNDAANGHPGGTGGTRWGTWVSELTLAGVPEPATWVMMLAGFGLVGASARRARRTTLAA